MTLMPMDSAIWNNLAVEAVNLYLFLKIYMRRSLNNGVPIIAAGLAAIVAGEYMVEDEKRQQIISNIGYILTTVGAAGVFISYVRDKLQ